MDRLYTYQPKRYVPSQRSAPKEQGFSNYQHRQSNNPVVSRFQPTTDKKKSFQNLHYNNNISSFNTQPQGQTQIQSSQQTGYQNVSTNGFQPKQGGMKINYVNPGKTQIQDDYQTHNPTWGTTNSINNSNSNRNLSTQIAPSQNDALKRPKYIKKKNQGTVNTLKSQLQNLKQEVSKLMTKQSITIKKQKSSINIPKIITNSKDDSMKPSDSYYQKQSPYDALQSYESQRSARENYYSSSGNNFLNTGSSSKKDRDLSDTVSVTSQRIIDQPLRKLSKKVSDMNYDHAHYMQLQNQLLKTQLRNLKNKYNAKKIQLTQKCDILQRKNEYLQIALKKSQESLLQYKDALNNQIQNIRLQVAKKYQIDLQTSNKKNEQIIKSLKHQAQKQTQTDNQYVQQKLKKLYEQISQKNKIINSLNIELNQIKADKQKINFQLKKQKYKNDDLFKQAQLSKRQLSRAQDYLQAQIMKKNELSKSLQTYKNKNMQLLGQLDKSQRMIPSYSDIDSRMYDDINHYKQIQSQLRIQISDINSKNKKLLQLQQADKIQIQHLKKSNDQSMKQVEQLSKMLRSQKQKNLENQESLRKQIQSIKKIQEQRIKVMKQQFDQRLQAQLDSVTINPTSNIQLKSQQNNNNQNKVKTQKNISDNDFQIKELIKKKDRLIKKWKAQYKILKVKIQEKEVIQKSKKTQADKYYQQYLQLKNRNRTLQTKNQALKKQFDDLSQKLKTLEVADAHFKTKLKKQGGKAEYQINVSKRQSSDLQQQIKHINTKLQQMTQKCQKQTTYRKQMEQKIFNLKLQDQTQITQIIEQMKKRVDQQDQKVNKYIKQIKSKDQTITKLKKQVRQLLQSKQNDIQEIKQKFMVEYTQEYIDKQLTYVQEIKLMTRQQTQIDSTKIIQITKEAGQIKQKYNQLEKQVHSLRQENKDLNRLYTDKLSQSQNSITAFNSQKQQYQQRLSQARMEKLQKQNNLSNQFKYKTQEIQSLRDDIRRLNSYFTFKESSSSFDGALKQQIQTNQKMREQIKKKTEELFQVKDSYGSLRSQYDNLKSEVEILKLKALSQKKNLQVNFDVEMQNLKNKMIIEEKKVSSLQQKMQLVLQQTKKKDSFIQTYIMGKKLPQNQKEFMTQFIKKYQIQMGRQGKSINQIMKNQSQQMQKLTQSNFNLLKELASMKQKLLMYQEQQVQDNDSPSRLDGSFTSPTSGKSNLSSSSVKRKI